MEVKKMRLKLNGLGCAHCANQIEENVSKLEYVQEASVNFVKQEIYINYNLEKISHEKALNKVKEIVRLLEPEVKVFDFDDDTNIKEEQNENNNFKIIRFSVGFIIYLLSILFFKEANYGIFMFAASYIIFSYDVLLTAIKNLFKGNALDENFLMSIATLGAFYIGEFSEAVAVMIFYQAGEYLQNIAVNKSRKSIASLMNIKAKYANLEKDGKIIQIDPKDVKIDDIVFIKPGEKVPVDGIIVQGKSQIDVSSLLGEPIPRLVKEDDEILSGSINIQALLKVRVTKEFVDSTVFKILEMVENASNKKAITEKLVTKFAKIYTPIVVLLAVLIAVIPTLILGFEFFNYWLYKCLVFLVVSCPCALVISVPLSFFSGIGESSKNGILIKGSNFIDSLSKVDTVVFDKTGTITEGIFEVVKISNQSDIELNEFIKIICSVENLSNHPIAKSILAINNQQELYEISNFEEIAGYGLYGTIAYSEILVGNDKLMTRHNIKYEKTLTFGTVVHISKDGKYLGNIVISDKIKEGSKETIEKLKAMGIAKTVMITGDRREIAEKIGKEIGIDIVLSELLPNEKVEAVEKLLGSGSTKIAFVGDGINDAPVLARVDVGIAMGGVGSDAAIEAADIVIMNDELLKIPKAISISKNTMLIVKQNIIFAMSVKVLVLLLSTIEYVPMWLAVFADVGVTLLVILNSIYFKKTIIKWNKKN